jgi:hypothetical protein
MRATIPLNEGAVKKADDEFYALHPELVVDGRRIALDPNDSTQAGPRTEWMLLYKKYGGGVEGDAPAKKKKPATPIEPCPLCGKGMLAIHVVDEAKKPIPGASVSVDGLGEKATEEAGIADYDAVDPGTYAIGAQNEFYTPVAGSPDSADVKEDTPTTETIVLKFEISSDLSTTVPDQSNPKVKVVYLTFDDGPEAGTQAV